MHMKCLFSSAFDATFYYEAAFRVYKKFFVLAFDATFYYKVAFREVYKKF